MGWERIVMLVITALLLFVWLPAIFISTRKVLRKGSRHSRPDRKSSTES